MGIAGSSVQSGTFALAMPVTNVHIPRETLGGFNSSSAEV